MNIRVDIPQSEINRAIKNISMFSLIRQNRVRQAVAKGALAIQKDAKELCPVDTGRLRASIANKFFNQGLTAEVGTNVEYAIPVHEGARGRRAQPFLATAYEQNKNDIISSITDALK